jgi:hypothetical protein
VHVDVWILEAIVCCKDGVGLSVGPGAMKQISTLDFQLEHTGVINPLLTTNVWLKCVDYCQSLLEGLSLSVYYYYRMQAVVNNIKHQLGQLQWNDRPTIRHVDRK